MTTVVDALDAISGGDVKNLSPQNSCYQLCQTTSW